MIDLLITFGFLILLGGFFLLLILLSGIRIIKEWERAPVLRLGRYVGVKGPGLIFIIPFIDRIPKTISLRIKAVPFASEQTLTKDNVPVNVDAVMYVKVVDPEKAILNVEDFESASYWAAQTTLREVIGRVELQELLSHREMIGEQLRQVIDEKTEEWGVKVVSVEIKDVVIPQILQDAMSRQAQAERERQARVTLAKAEFEAAELMLKAAEMYREHPEALTLRWMNMLFEIGREGTNTLIFVPANIPQVGLPIIGLKGIEDIMKKKGE